MNSLLLTLTALVILVLSALFAAPLFIDWNDHRSAIEAQMTKLVGRDVKIGGKVHLIVLPAPQLKFDDIRVANADGSLETPFLEAKVLEAKLDVGTLLTGKVEAHQLTIVDPTLRLRLNGAGGGNWTDLGPLNSDAAFVPTDVLLDSVYVTGGTLEVAKDGGSAFVFRDINGEASASSLAGPYKVEANYDFDGRQQSIRFSTGIIDDSGRFRVKTALRDPRRSTSYQLDGKVLGLRNVPLYEGAFTMRVSEFEARRAEKPTQGDGDLYADSPTEISVEMAAVQGTARRLPDTASFFEVKGPLKATPDSAELSGFELTLHASGRPQILKGDVALDFRPPYKADATLAARWIDFDALFGATDSEDRPAPAAVVRMLSDWVLDEAAKVGQGTLSLDVEQAGLGGDLAGDLSLKLASADGGVAIEELNATLPGENRVSASGTLRKGASGPLFEGSAEIDGSGLPALARWAAGDRAITGQSFVGDFSLSADTKVGEGEVTLLNAKGAVSGTPFGGSFHYRAGETNVINLDFRSDRLDLRETLGEEPIWAAWLPSQSGETATQNTSDGTKLLKKLRDDEVNVRLEIGELLMPDIAPGRLDAALSLNGGDLEVQSLSFVAPGAMTLGGKGQIENLADAPSGQIDLSLQAQTTDSLRLLAALAGVGDRVAKSEHFSALAPIDISAALVAVRAGEVTDASLELNGKVGGSNLSLVAKAKGTLAKARDAAIDVSGSVAGDRPQALLVLLFPDLPQDRLAKAAGGQGTLDVKAAGVPSEQLTGRAALETTALQLAFEGMGALKDDDITLNGFASVATTDASLALPLLGLDPPPSALGVPLSVSASVASESGNVHLEQIKATVSDQPLEGEARFSRSEGVTAFDITAAAEHASLPALMGLLVAWERAESTKEMLGAIDDDAASVWPARGLSLSLLNQAAGTISLSTQTLSLGEPFQVSGGKLRAKVDRGKLAIESIDGELFGGTLVGSGSLSPRGSGAALTAKASLQQGNLELLTEALSGAPFAKGAFDLSFYVAGDGLSPPGIVADLGGKGTVTLGAGTLTTFSAAPLRRIAAKAAASNQVATAAQLDADAEKIQSELKKGRYAFEPVTLEFDVKNGTMRFAPTSLTSKDVVTDLETYVDLVGLKLDSEWQMRLTSAQAASVPPLTVVFAGPLDNADTIAPAVGTAAIENKMTIDRLRQDVERLETLDVSGGRAPSDAQAETAAKEAEAKEAAAKDAAAKAAVEAKAKAKAAAEQAARERAEAEARAAEQKAIAEKAAQQNAAREAEAAEQRAAAAREAAQQAAEVEAARQRAVTEERAEAEKRAADAARAAAEANAAAELEAAKRAAAEARAAAEKAAQERAAAEARAAAELKAAAEARAAADQATKARAAAEARAATERAKRQRIEAEAKAAAEARASLIVPDELLPPLPTNAPANDNAALGDPIADLLDGEETAEDSEEAEEPVAAPPERPRRRALRRSRRNDWRRNYGPFGGLFGGR